jgi:uncharacterized protein (DUF4415 family)
MPIVSYDLDHLPKAPEEERVKIAAMSDEDIDYSDIPEVCDFSEFVRAKPFRATKEQSRVEIDLDSDVIAWIGKDYQFRINAILREVMNLSKIISS